MTMTMIRRPDFDPRHHARKWVSGDLLTIKRRGRNQNVYAYTDANWNKQATDGWAPSVALPREAKLLFLGEISESRRLDHFAKVWWDRQVFWVPIDYLRLLTQGKPKQAQNPV